jgi:hypothetical protein
MTLFVYRCPDTEFQVQAYSPLNLEDGVDTYETVTCTICGKVHLINPATGKVLGEDEE